MSSDDHYIHHALKASLEVAIEKLSALVTAAGNTAASPFVKRQLKRALQELLKLSPDQKLVDEAIAAAEKRSYRGEELAIAREWREKSSRKRAAKGRKAKRSYKRSSSKARKAPAKAKRAPSKSGRSPGGRGRTAKRG